MTHSDEKQPVFPQQGTPDIPSLVSSLTRSDFDGVLDMLGIAPLDDWQWRVVVGLGLLREQERVAAGWRAAAKRPSIMYVPREAESLSLLEQQAGGPLTAAEKWTLHHPNKPDQVFPLVIYNAGEKVSAESVGEGHRWRADSGLYWVSRGLGGAIVWALD